MYLLVLTEVDREVWRYHIVNLKSKKAKHYNGQMKKVKCQGIVECYI